MKTPQQCGTNARVSKFGASHVEDAKPLSRLRIRKSFGDERISVRTSVDGKRTERTFLTEQHAEAWQRLIERLGPQTALQMLEARNVNAATANATLTVDELMTKYHESRRTGVEPATIEHYEMFARTGITPFMGSMPAHQVSREDVVRWVDAEQATGRSPRRRGCVRRKLLHTRSR